MQQRKIWNSTVHDDAIAIKFLFFNVHKHHISGLVRVKAVVKAAIELALNLG